MFSISATRKVKMNHFTLYDKKKKYQQVFSALVDWMNLRVFSCSKEALKVLKKTIVTFKDRR